MNELINQSRNGWEENSELGLKNINFEDVDFIMVAQVTLLQ
jgi:hypothetical protein